MSAIVHHGDCLDVMRGMPDGSADAFVMDPPYTAAGGSTNGRSSDADTQFFLYWLRDIMTEVRRIVRPAGCGFTFCDWRTIGLLGAATRPRGDRIRGGWGGGWTQSQALVWDRESIGLGSPFRNSYEMIAFARGPEWKSGLSKDIPSVVRYRYPYGRHEHHGSEKPVGLCVRLVEWAAPPGAVVLDPFAGSGTVGVACVRSGRNYVGIESEEYNVEIARKRIADATEQGNLFAGTL